MTPEKTEETVSVLNDDGTRKTGEQIREVSSRNLPTEAAAAAEAQQKLWQQRVVLRRRACCRHEDLRHKGGG